MGDITVELYWKHAPNTCRNFAELARRCYYNNVKFHRIIRDFMIQGKLNSTNTCFSSQNCDFTFVSFEIHLKNYLLSE